MKSPAVFFFLPPSALSVSATASDALSPPPPPPFDPEELKQTTATSRVANESHVLPNSNLWFTWRAALKKKTKEFQGQLNDVQGHNNLHAQVESRVLQTQSGEVAPLTSEQKMVGTVNSPYNKDRILEPVSVDGAAKADTTPCGCEKS